MINIVKVIDLKALDYTRLWLCFSDGQEGVRDCTDILASEGPMVQPLRDPVMFRRVFLSFGVPSWPNGFDLDAINLHMELEAAGALRRSDAA